MANTGQTRTPMTLRSVRPGPGELGVLLAPRPAPGGRRAAATIAPGIKQDVHRVEPADDVGARPLAAEDQVRRARSPTNGMARMIA